MAYDEVLAARFRKAVAGLETITEKRMMGGVCFMLNGNMLGGADRDKTGTLRFMFRVGKDLADEALARPGAMPVDLGARRIGGMVFVDAETCDANELADWIVFTLKFVGSLPAKT